jgi:hypothetical protein
MGDWGNKDGRKLTAYILLGIAVYVGLANIGVLDFLGIRDLIRWIFRTLWSLLPTAVLVLGVYWLSKSGAKERSLIPWLVIGVGALMMIAQFDLFGLSFGDLAVPLWLAVIAFFILNPRELLPKRMNTSTEQLEEGEENLNLIAFMGGGELHYDTQRLKGGEIIAVMGGYDIDFREADMEGDSMELNLICFMGGVEIKVPAHWDVVKPGAVCIMGGFSIKAQCRAEDLDLPRKKLIIRGIALMGGGEIRN